MPESITRRAFIKGSTALGVTSILGGRIDGWLHAPAFAASGIDIAAVEGADYFKSTIKAVELLGGMGKFVSQSGAKARSLHLRRNGSAHDERPELVNLLLREPLAFSHPKYLRGPLGLMNHYRFDRENIFRIREGLIGAVDDCRAMVFRYTDDSESAEAYEYATTRLSAGSRFTNHTRQGNRYAMVGGEKERVVVLQTSRYIAIVIGQDQERVKATSDRLVQKLRSG